ncbi:MAG: glycosyltransferase family 4 protein [Patescibacteria group bacterium]
MKILMLNNLATTHGGAEAMIAQLRRGLEKEGHQVRILCGSRQGNGKKIADATFLVPKEGSLALQLMHLFNPFAFLALRKELRDFRPDVVHLHTVSKSSPFILLPLKKFPTVLTMHDQSLFDPTRVSDLPLIEPYRETFADYFIDKPSARFYAEKLRFFILRRLAKNVDTVLACSDFYADCARNSGIFSNIKTLHNGTVLLPPSRIENSKVILFVGRLSEEKGVPVLLEAVALLKKKHPDMQLHIVGDGQQVEELKKETVRLQMENIVRFLGHKSSQEIAELYKQSSLVAVPSLCPDNLPTVCMEAMSVGRPIVASRIGGVPELVDNEKTGFLVPPNDVGALSGGIDRLLSDPGLMQNMGEAGREKAEKEFDEKIYVKNTLAQYNLLINKYQNV